MSSNSHIELSEEWFVEIGDPLHQGDLLINFPLPAMTSDPGSNALGLSRANMNVIVVTQSCDIPKVAQTELLLASVFDYADLEKRVTYSSRPNFGSLSAAERTCPSLRCLRGLKATASSWSSVFENCMWCQNRMLRPM